MIKAAVIYSFVTKSGETGSGRIFLDIPHLPLTELEYLDLEHRIVRDSNVYDAFVYNIIPLAEEDEK